MGLSSDLLNSFAKITNDSSKKKTESVVYGTVTEYPAGSGNMYVQLDGAANDMLTPYEPTVEVSDGQRVAVTIKNHTATVNGNISSPAATIGTTNNIIAQNATITGKLTAAEAEIVELNAKKASIEELEANYAKITDLEAVTANIESLDADIVNVNTQLTATNGKINNLEATNAEFHNATAKNLAANNAVINSLDNNYANIDFANIGQAAVDKFFATSGIIKNLTLESGVVVKELVGVTIKGDLIEGNTIVADKLVVQGDDGLYYKLNFESGNFKDAEEVPRDGLHGSVIVANSITAEKMSVSDLEAFKATIGGFHIGEHSLYSGVKESPENTTSGVYLGDDGSLNVGNSVEYLRYIPDGNGNYKLEIQAESIKIGTGHKDIQTAIQEEIDSLTIGARNLLTNTKTFENMVTSDDTVTFQPADDGFNACCWSIVPEKMWRALSITPEIPLDSEHAFGKEFTISFMYRSHAWSSIQDDTDEDMSPIVITIGARDDTVEFPSRTRWKDVFGLPEESKTLFASGDWQKIAYTFTFGDDISWLSQCASDDANATSFFFQIWNHSMYDLEVKQIKLEYGNTATDWSPAPDDVIETITSKYNDLDRRIADLSIENGEIRAYAETVKTNVDDSVLKINNRLDLAVTPEFVDIQIKNAQTNQVTTTTGYTLNEYGLTVSKSGNPITTQISENGMSVKVNTDTVLEANEHGVDAKNLNASTFLIVGGRSRFENYKWDRTACFWVGG